MTYHLSTPQRRLPSVYIVEDDHRCSIQKIELSSNPSCPPGAESTLRRADVGLPGEARQRKL